jgi:hypothetical protein
MTDDSDSNLLVSVLASLAFIAVWMVVYAAGCVWRKVREVVR